jgi:hypothetical protein
MKKLVILALAAFFAMPCFAQLEPVYTSSDGKATFDVLGHLGMGYHITKSNDFKPGWCDEFFVNIVKFGFYPVESFGFELGVDLQVNDFNTKEKAFVQRDGIIKTADFSTIETLGGVDRKRSDFTTVSLGAPVMLKAKIEKVGFGIGAVASWNFAGSNSYWVEKANRHMDLIESKAKVNPFSYGLVATASYGVFGVYFKYYPKSSRLLPEGSVDLSYTTIGIVLGM